jgi:hypothetical protein
MSSDFATYLLRSLLSEGCVRYETVMKTAEGPQPRLIEREGPTGLIVTTTALHLHPENETRLLSITVTDTQEQTKAIFAALATEADQLGDYSRWHALQSWLATGDADVTIPFAGELAQKVPPVAVRLRRDFGAILHLIRAHALLHQATRERSSSGAIVADERDYIAIRELVEDLVSEGIGATVPPTIRETVEAVRELAGTEGETNIVAVAKRLHLDKSAGWRRVRSAIDRGYVQNLEDRRGRPARLVLGEEMPGEVVILPERLHGCTQVEGDMSTPLPPCIHCGAEADRYDEDGEPACGVHSGAPPAEAAP